MTEQEFMNARLKVIKARSRLQAYENALMKHWYAQKKCDQTKGERTNDNFN